MPNDSSTGGFLLPTVVPLDDVQFDNLIHDWIAGVSGLDPTLVRPSWQPDPPPLPDFTVPCWAAFGILRVHNDWDAVVQHYAGYSTTLRYQQMELMTTWYGAAAGDVALQFRMGTAINQNQDLFYPSVKFVSVEDQVTMSENIKGRWQRRVDVTVVLRRLVQCTYAVLDLVAARLEIILANGRTVTRWVNIGPGTEPPAPTTGYGALGYGNEGYGG